MAAIEALTPLAYGAPVIVLEGSLQLHLPSVYRLGRGTLHKPISHFLRLGTVPLKWTSSCGHWGIVVFHRGPLLGLDVCDQCRRLTLEVS